METQNPLPNFRPTSIVAAAWIKMPLGTEVGLVLRDFVLDGDPAPPPLKGYSLQFSANVRCGQTAGWTMMLRKEVPIWDRDKADPH